MIVQYFFKNSIGIALCPGTFPLVIEWTPEENSFSIISLERDAFMCTMNDIGEFSKISLIVSSDTPLCWLKFDKNLCIFV